MSARRLSAEWVYPVVSPPIPSGAVLIGEDGRLVAVGPDHDVVTPPGIPTDHFPNAVLMPGLVNCHSHLELTGLAGQATEDDFSAWIRSVRRLKEERTPEMFREAALEGVARSLAAGVTTVAETGDSGAVAYALDELGGRGVVYQEVFGPHRDQCHDSLARLQEQTTSLESFVSPRVRVGLSPHAPYTVSDTLYRAVVEMAAHASLPLAVHIAESHAESDFLATGGGPFGEAWERRGIPLPEPLGDTPIAWLERHGVLQPGTLCIHCVRLESSDIALLAERGCVVAHCPRSNRRHGHGTAPLSALLAAGIPTGLGTDSEVSLDPPDLLAEARLAADLAGLDAGRALELVTDDGARALGWGDVVGALAPGRWADVALRRLEPSVTVDHLAQVILQGQPEAIGMTIVGGVERYRAP